MTATKEKLLVTQELSQSLALQNKQIAPLSGVRQQPEPCWIWHHVSNGDRTAPRQKFSFFFCVKHGGCPNLGSEWLEQSFFACKDVRKITASWVPSRRPKLSAVATTSAAYAEPASRNMHNSPRFRVRRWRKPSMISRRFLSHSSQSVRTSAANICRDSTGVSVPVHALCLWPSSYFLECISNDWF